MNEVNLDESSKVLVPFQESEGGYATEIPDDPILNELLIQYDDFCKRLRRLIVNVQAYYAAIATLSTISVAVANDMAELALKTPLSRIMGTPMSPSSVTIADTASTATTFLSIYQSLASQAEKSRTHYGEMVLNVVVLWESVVTSRIDACLKKEQKMRTKLARHQDKVDTLQRSIDSEQSKGEYRTDEQSEDLATKKNELKKLQKKYNNFNDNLCLMIGEVVHQAWRDLQPVLLETAKHEMSASADQAETMKKLAIIIDQVQAIREDEDFVNSSWRFDVCDRIDAEDFSVSVLTEESRFTERSQRQSRTRTDVRRESLSESLVEEESTDTEESGRRTPRPSMEIIREKSPGSLSRRRKKKRIPKNDGSPPLVNARLLSNEEVTASAIVSPQSHAAVVTSASVCVGNPEEDEVVVEMIGEPNHQVEIDVGGMTARCGHIHCIQRLLEKVAKSINTTDRRGCSPLHYASEMGFEDCVQTLLDHEAIVDTVDNEGYTSLHLACAHGKASIVRLLIERGANLDVANGAFWRPIHLAAQNGHLDCLSILIEKGAKVFKQEGDPWTALHVACSNGFEDCAKVLIEACANVDDVDRTGSTALQKATEKDSEECVRLLLKNKANPNKMDNEGYTPLIAAALEGNRDIMKVLLRHVAEVDQAHPDGWTPLHLAADYGFGECLKLLLKHGANVNAKNEDGWSALHKAAEQGHFDCVDMLLKKGADLEATNGDGFRALHVASFNGRPKCVELLLDRNAQINQQDKNGCTALHWAASEGRLECAKVLIERLADTTLKDANGHTASQAAALKGHLVIKM